MELRSKTIVLQILALMRFQVSGEKNLGEPQVETYAWQFLSVNNEENGFPLTADMNFTEDQGADDITTTYSPKLDINSEDTADEVNLKSTDLSQDYIPPYCRCTNKNYCLPPQKVQRTERAINNPPCAGRDQVMCCLTSGPGCGVPADFPYFNPYPLYGEANFAEYPWTALILDRSQRIIYGHGVLINWRYVVTAARNVVRFNGKKIFKVRLGDWDLTAENEPFQAKEYLVENIVVHPRFNPQTFQNDIALLRLAEAVDLSSYPNIRSVCLSKPDDIYRFEGAKCLVAGWGTDPAKSAKDFKASVLSADRNNKLNILKEVDMQTIDSRSCQRQIRKYVGDPNFILDDHSFLCTAGRRGKGLCQGDEGAALVCQEAPGGRYKVLGISSWGNTCGETNTPTVFINMPNYYDWINSVTKG